MTLRVLVVDDHAVVREGVKRIIEDAPGLQVVGEAGDPLQALQRLQKIACDVLVLDLDLPGRGGLELLREIKRLHPTLAVLVLSFHTEEAYGVPSLQAGGDGYLMKDSSTAQLVLAIHKVASGGKFVTPALAEQLACAVGVGAHPLRHEALSDREREVLRLIGSGLSVGQIAERTALSVKTVSTYRRRVLDKMGVVNNAQLTHYAIKHQLV